MTLPEAIEIIRTHNEWRLGAEIQQTEPIALTVAIDVILLFFDQNKPEQK